MQTLIASNTEAAEGRRRVYEKIEELRSSHTELRSKVDGMAARLEDMEPHVKEFADMQQKVRAGGWIGRRLWILGGFLLAGAAWIVTTFREQIAVLLHRGP